MTVLSRDWEEDVPERLRRYFSQFFTGNIRFPGNGIRERRPLKCVSLTKTGKIQNVHTHIKQLKYNARKTRQIKYKSNCVLINRNNVKICECPVPQEWLARLLYQ